MSPREQRNFRLSDQDDAALNGLVVALGVNPSEAVRQCLPSLPLCQLFRYGRLAGHLGTGGYQEWLEKLIADSARQEMLTDREYPVDPACLPLHFGSKYVIAYYLDYLACRDVAYGMPASPHYKAATGHVLGCELVRLTDGTTWQVVPKEAKE